MDWEATGLGAIEAWSPALRNAVELALHTQFPVTLLWGPEFVMIYNEGYIPLIADKHPAALGRPARDVFPEAWDARYTPLLSSHDPGEKPLAGGLLVAPYGKGTFVYTSYVWYRQLRGLVPGGHRVFANLISLPKAPR